MDISNLVFIKPQIPFSFFCVSNDQISWFINQNRPMAQIFFEIYVSNKFHVDYIIQ